MDHSAQVSNHRRLDVAAVVDFNAIFTPQATNIQENGQRHLAIKGKTTLQNQDRSFYYEKYKGIVEQCRHLLESRSTCFLKTIQFVGARNYSYTTHSDYNLHKTMQDRTLNEAADH
jgi:ATP sulfurylase